jgi:DNA-binding transcriptional MerR regulator
VAEKLLTLDELCSQLALALSSGYEGAPNERIRDVPDPRTVRYYTTLGLVDRPAQMRGRTALYGRRHLLQLVAIKRLQANGLSLHEVQQRLPGLSDRELEEIAQLPELPESPPERAAAEPPKRRDFWKSAPSATAEEAADVAPPAVMQGVPLDDRVVLLLPLRRVPDAGDVEAIHAAAGPLLRLLRRRRLVD